MFRVMIIKLQKRDNTMGKAWATKIIMENLLKKQACTDGKKIYIMSRGMKIAKKIKNYYIASR